HHLLLLRDERLVDGLLNLRILVGHPAKHSHRGDRDSASGEEVCQILLNRIADLLFPGAQPIERILCSYFSGHLLDSSAHFAVHHFCQRPAWIPIQESGSVFLANEGGAGEAHAESDAVGALDPDSFVILTRPANGGILSAVAAHPLARYGR